MSTIPVQPDKLARPTLTWRTKGYNRARKGRKRRASQQGLPCQDNGSTPSGMSPVQHNTAELSSECGLVSAPKRAKIVTHSAEIGETSCSHILSVSVQETVNLHTADREDLSSLHILSITDIEGVPNPHSNKRQEIPTEVSNLSITGSNSQSSVVLRVASNENEQADLHDADKDTANLKNQHEVTSEISVHEGVSPVGDFLPSRKRPHEQFEELFEAAALTKLKRRRKSHTRQRWKQVKGGSRGRRWRRWKKEENWKRRERKKRNQCRKKEGMFATHQPPLGL